MGKLVQNQVYICATQCVRRDKRFASVGKDNNSWLNYVRCNHGGGEMLKPHDCMMSHLKGILLFLFFNPGSGLATLKWWIFGPPSFLISYFRKFGDGKQGRGEGDVGGGQRGRDRRCSNKSEQYAQAQKSGCWTKGREGREGVRELLVLRLLQSLILHRRWEEVLRRVRRQCFQDTNIKYAWSAIIFSIQQYPHAATSLLCQLQTNQSRTLVPSS